MGQQITMYQCTSDDLQRYVSGSFKATIGALCNAGYITVDEHNHLMDNLVVNLNSSCTNIESLWRGLPNPDNFKQNNESDNES